MISVDKLKTLFAEKLLATSSLDAAIKKACWVAYKKGLEDGKKRPTGPKFKLNGVKSNGKK